MIEFDGDPLPAGHIDLVEAFDELRNRKHGESPWWEQQLPKDEVEQAAWTVRFNSEWDEDVAELSQAFKAGDLVALVHSPRLKGSAQITRSEWENCAHPDELFLTRTVTGFMNSSMKRYIGHTAYTSANSYFGWLERKYPSRPKAKQQVRRPSSGSKPRYDWQAFDRQALSILDERGVPDVRVDPTWTLAALEGLMMEWCIKHWGISPADSTIRKNATRVIKLFERQRSSPA
jgi:hypothetical protein